MGSLQTGQSALLDSYYLPLRSQVVNEWRQVTHSERQADKLALLNLASQNDDWQTRFSAVSQLFSLTVEGMENQPDLFEKAFDLWQHSQDIGQQQAVTNLLEKNVQAIAKQLEAQPIVVKQLFTLFDSPQRKN